jgi:hypothetical protein
VDTLQGVNIENTLFIWYTTYKVVYQMEKRKGRNFDRHVNSKSYGLRLDNDMLEKLTKQAEKEGRSRRAIIIELLDDYLSKNGD